MRLGMTHKWDIGIAEARKIQEKLRAKWVGEDRFEGIRTVAGLDAAFVLTGSQGFEARRKRWTALREANRAIGAGILYKYPEMEEMQRGNAGGGVQIPYVTGILEFLEI